MSQSTFFVQECPTCGRNLQIRVQHMGKDVVCQHCRARFEACDPNSATYPSSNSGLALLHRVEELLNAENATRSRPR